MRFGVLGPLTVLADGEPVPVNGRKQRLLLAVLLSRSGRTVPVDDLVDALWGEEAPDGARKTLRWHAHRLRGVLGERERERLATGADGYTLAVGRGELDACRFERLYRDGLGAYGDGAYASAADLLAEALELWRGPAFGELADAPALAGTAVRLDELRLSALVTRVDADLALGRHADLVTELPELVARYPFAHRFAEQLMLALHRSGRSADALDVYGRTRDRLAEELGIDPPETLRALHQRILREDPGLGAGIARRNAPTAAVVRELPPSQSGFTGRTDVLDRLSAESASGRTVLLVTGMAGIGKTATVLRWAHHATERFADGQLFVDLRGFTGQPATDPADALAMLLTSLGVPGTDMPATLDARVGRYRSLLAERRMLVVLDNAASAAQVRPLLPGNPACLTVVTSRDRLPGLVARDGAVPVPLRVLTDAESRALLRDAVGTERVAAETAQVRTLIELCGGLPLALRIAAAELAEDPRRTFAELVAGLTEERIGALSAIPDPDVAVRTLFQHSYRALDEDARTMFRLLGAVPWPNISVGVGCALTRYGPEAARAAMEALVSAHLMDRAERDRYVFHDLLRQYARELLAVERDTRETATRRLYDHYLSAAYRAAILRRPDRVSASAPTVPPDVYEEPFADRDAAVGWLTAERSNMAVAIRYALDGGRTEYAWQLCDALTNDFTSSGNLVQWRGMLDRALAAGTTTESRAVLLCNLAFAARSQGDAHGAIGLLEEALPLLERTGQTRRRIDSYLFLAHCHADVGRLDKGAAYARKARDVAVENAEEDQIDTALGVLGVVYMQAGRSDEAVAASTEAVERKRRAAASTLCNALGNLSLVLLDAGQVDRALTIGEEALATAEAVGAPASVMSTLDNLARIRVACGDPRAARRDAHRALALSRKLGARRTEAFALVSLAMALDPPEAIPTARQALDLAGELDVPAVLMDAHVVLAEAHRRVGEPVAALEHASTAAELAVRYGFRAVEKRARALLEEIRHSAAI